MSGVKSKIILNCHKNVVHSQEKGRSMKTHPKFPRGQYSDKDFKATIVTTLNVCPTYVLQLGQANKKYFGKFITYYT
jgi:hypothetical protein